MDGYKLRELRESHCYSRQEFADIIGVDENMVEDWEEYGYSPSSYNVERMASALNLDEDSLKWKLNLDRSIDDSDSSLGLGGTLLALGALAGIAAYGNYKNKKAEEERQAEAQRKEALIKEQERQRVKAEQKRAKRQEKYRAKKAQGKNIGFSIFKKKLVTVGYSSNDLIGLHYEDAIQKLEASGFKNVFVEKTEDIYVDSNYTEGEVGHISIDGEFDFERNSVYPYDVEVLITYHSKRKIAMPVSSRSVKKANYLMLIEELKCAGFTAYRTEALEDLRVGLLKKNGAVDRMIVDKSSSFKKGTKYPFDVDIQIIYHSYMPKSQ